MEILAEEIGKQGAKVKALKESGGPKEEIDAEVAKLVDLKKKITELDPKHPLAIVEKKKKKKTASSAPAPAPASGEEVSKNEAKKLAKKAAKKDKKEQHKSAAGAEPAAKGKSAVSEAVYYCGDAMPLVSMATGSDVPFVCEAARGGLQPRYEDGDKKVFGDAAVARLLLRKLGNASAALGGTDAYEASLVDQWVDFSLSYPSVGDVESFVAVLDKRLEGATYLVGDRLTLADMACWAVVTLAKPTTSANVARWLKLCDAQPALAKAKSTKPVAAANATTKKAAATSSSPATTSGGQQVAGACPPLEGAEEGKVVTRFPPEPSGYLHIGHAKALLLNAYYAKRYKGTLLIRFDDTNPSKEKEEYAANIIADLETLGIDTSHLSHTSDHFDKIKECATKLIKSGNAFMDDTPQEKMREEREERVHSKHRDASVATNLERFKAMCEGSAPEFCLRAKIDMSSDNGTLRDPVLYRANDTPHHRTGTRYKAYPTYDLACPIVDSFEGVTHALRTTEYNDRDAQYQWLQQAMKLRPVKIHAFSRINFVRTLMSKRKLAWLVDQGAVDGWDDPRFPTIQGVVRRGVSVSALRDFMVAQGASRNIVNLEWDSFWATNKAAYEPVAPRYMAVDEAGHSVMTVSFAGSDKEGAHYITAPLVPKDPSLGTRALRIASRVMIEKEDAASLKVGEEVVLIRWGVVKVVGGDAESGFSAEFHPDGIVKKKKTLHWLADVEDSKVKATLVEYDYLITKPKLEEEDKLEDNLTPVSMVETPAFADPALKHLDKGSVLQLERRGFYRVDVPFSPKTPPRLILIPDGKTKAPFTRLPHH